MKRKTLPKIDYVLLIIAGAILAFGLITLLSASSVLSFQRFGNNYYYFLRQLLFGVVPGLIAMYVLSRIDYHVWQKYAPVLVLAGIVMLVAVLIPGIGFKVGNARRWINFGAFLFQPAEFVKLALVFYLASWYDKRQQHAHDLYYGFLPTLALVGLVSGLNILQPYMGTMISQVCNAAGMFFIG
ncbi:MAG: FtsW/RodA/SpoVE family cell cycle protein, partial [Candidatus Saccharibacteria bacterium]